MGKKRKINTEFKDTESNEFQLYGETRNLLQQTERLDTYIKSIRNCKLREILFEILKTCQADLLNFLDTIYQIKQCGTDSEINELLSKFYSPDNEI